MWMDAELVLSSYKPLKLEKRMMFAVWEDTCHQLYELKRNIVDMDPYMTINGHPVEPNIFDTSHENKLADPYEIGWVDEGDDSDEMHEITIDDLNVILRNKHRCKIQINDKLYEKDKMLIPVYDEEKVVIRLIEED